MKISQAVLVPLFVFNCGTILAANVVTDWNSIASTTIVANAGKNPAASAVWFAYSSLAVYDAVNAIIRQYQPFYYRFAAPAMRPRARGGCRRAPRPGQLLPLAAGGAGQSVCGLAGGGSGWRRHNRGRRRRRGRRNGGDRSPSGRWFGGRCIPMLRRPARRMDPHTSGIRGRGCAMARPDAALHHESRGGLPAERAPTLNSEDWKRDYNLTRLYGGTNSTIRSAAETEIGLFYTENTGQQYARMFNALATANGLGIADSARMMAILWTGYADAAIGCFNAKYKFGFWRPVTAIPAGSDASVLPGSTGRSPRRPNLDAFRWRHPGPSRVSRRSRLHRRVRSHLDCGLLRHHPCNASPLDSKVFADGVHQHTFTDTRGLMDEVFWARIYAGFHFYHSLEAGRQLGQSVAGQLARNHFRQLQPR